MSQKKSKARLRLDRETLEAQRAARNDLKRDTIILFSVLVVGLFFLWFVVKYIHLTIPFLLIIYATSNWRRWHILRKHNLHCPHCEKPLAEGIKLHKSPNYDSCPHCGKRALATAKQLQSGHK